MEELEEFGLSCGGEGVVGDGWTGGASAAEGEDEVLLLEAGEVFFDSFVGEGG